MSSRAFHPSFPFAPGRFPFFYGWVIAFGSMLGALFSLPGQTMGFAVFTEILMTEFDLSRVALSSAYFVGTVLSGLTLPMAGRLFDHWGARKMIVFSSILTGLVLIYLSEAADLSRWISVQLPNLRTVISFTIIGVGFYLIRFAAQGILTLTSRNVLGKWFDVRRGMALSISGIFISFGFSISPKMLDILINRLGYDGAWQFLAVLTLFFMAPVGWLIYRDNPEECGLKMDGPNARPPERENLDMVIHREYTRNEALRTFSFHAFNLSFAFFALYSTAFTFHIESIGMEFGFEKARIINFFIPMAIISVVVNLFFGWVNSKTRLKFLLLIMNIGAVLAAVGLYRLSSSWGVVLYVFGTGLTGGIFGSLSGVVFPRFFGRKWLGSIAGIGMSTMVIASGIGPWLFAWSREQTGSYQWILIVSIFVPAALCITSLFADNPQRRMGALN